MSDALKNSLDHAVGTGFTVKLLALINSTHTALDGQTRDAVTKFLDGIGEMTAFEAACAANTAAATFRNNYAIVNRLEHELGGRGNAEELVLCIADGTVT
jgi:hypothetical protein